MANQQAATLKEEKIVNGVNVTQLANTIDAIRQQPELADFKFRAKNKWSEGSQNRATIEGFYGTCQEIAQTKPFEFTIDEPPVLLGKSEGANPVEYVLAGLSGCLTTTLVYHAAAEGIKIDGIESNYEGDLDLKGFLNLDPNARNGYKEIRVNFKVKTDAEKEKLAELMKKSPVFDIVTNPTPVKVNIVTE